MYQLEFITEPVAKGRPRFARAGNFVRTFTPEKTRNAEAELRFMMRDQFKEKPLEGPLIVNLQFEFVRPKSVSVKKRPYHCVRPDLDNVLKVVKDAGNGILWRDDSQIFNLTMCKSYADQSKIILVMEEVK